MSETITKACPSCGGKGEYGHELLGIAKCSRCEAGRVPDVEATLRAEVARLTAERDRWQSIAKLETSKGIMDHDGALCFLRAKISECAAMGLELGRRLTERDAELATARAEVERLKAERP